MLPNARHTDADDPQPETALPQHDEQPTRQQCRRTSSPRSPSPLNYVHRGVLDNQDLLGRIFEYCEVSNSGPLGLPVVQKRDLASIALTCRSFLEPALNILWREMDSLVPLLSLLPAFQLENHSYVLRGPIQDEDWERYHFYARRVREYTYLGEVGHDGKIANHTKVRLAQRFRTPLLPCLRRFCCPDVTVRGLFIHFLFLTPSIEHVELRNISEYEDEAVGTLLSTLGEEVPLLKHLVLTGSLRYPQLKYVPDLHALRTLELHGMGPAITPKLIQDLSKLEHLSELTVDLNQAPTTTFSGAGGFSKLTKLVMTASFSTIKSVLSSIDPYAPLCSLSMIALSGALDGQWRAQCSAVLDLVASRWSSTFHSLSFENNPLNEQDAIPLTMLAPILRLKHMTDLHMRNYVLSLTDEDVRTFATSWPALRSLHLSYDANAVKPSMEALYILANQCPELRSLQIGLSIDTIPPLSAYAAPARHSSSSSGNRCAGGHKLESMHIATDFAAASQWDKRDMILVARHIDRTFPHLARLEPMMSDGLIFTWQSICTMVDTLQAVRAEGLDQ